MYLNQKSWIKLMMLKLKMMTMSFFSELLLIKWVLILQVYVVYVVL